MLVMPANNSKAHQLESRYPGRLGMLFGLEGFWNPRGLPYALDNGRFPVWQRGKDWDEAKFWRLIEKAQALDYSPRWLVVPDRVGDAFATLCEWQRWAEKLSPLGWPLALAVQDGMTEANIACLARKPDVIFMGGTTDWKRRTIWQWCQAFPRVHVGRVNTEKWLWNAHRCGAESVDGTGFFRGDQMQLRGLLRYLKRSSLGMGPAQLEFEFSHAKDPATAGRP